jgi:hypothetical protein
MVFTPPTGKNKKRYENVTGNIHGGAGMYNRLF